MLPINSTPLPFQRNFTTLASPETSLAYCSATVSPVVTPLSVVIVKANTNAQNPNTRAVMFHLGQFIPSGVPDTYGFNGIDSAVTTGDTVALQYANEVSGLASVVKFRWNGNGVELIGNTPG